MLMAMAFIETEKEQEQLVGGVRIVIPQSAAQLQQPLRLLMVTLKFDEPTSIVIIIIQIQETNSRDKSTANNSPSIGKNFYCYSTRRI